MRLVLDTNTALSVRLWSGTPGRLLDLKSFLGIVIVTAAAAVERLQAQRED